MIAWVTAKKYRKYGIKEISGSKTVGRKILGHEKGACHSCRGWCTWCYHKEVLIIIAWQGIKKISTFLQKTKVQDRLRILARMQDMWTPENDSTPESFIIGYDQLLWKSIGLRREQVLNGSSQTKNRTPSPNVCCTCGNPLILYTRLNTTDIIALKSQRCDNFIIQVHQSFQPVQSYTKLMSIISPLFKLTHLADQDWNDQEMQRWGHLHQANYF